MNKLPSNVLLVMVRHSNKYSNLTKLCKEFFKGIPHIVCPGYDEAHSVHLCYIVRSSRGLQKFLYKASELYFRDKILDYGYYSYDPETVWEKAFRYGACVPPCGMSGSIALDTNTIKKLKTLVGD